MLSFTPFPLEEGVPIYVQIVRHVKRGIVSGSVQDGDELPSRRVLSAQLGVNPNTVQKAYRLLEDEGIISSHAGAKSAVTLTPERRAVIRGELLAQTAEQVARTLRQMGVDLEEARALLERAWYETETEVDA
ncbi:MAG: GntR family transcriptional regulator [Flavonifractor sp.]|nr:GntR family transcriptional regulator [Flavonifractor sp.]MCI9424870.1 GntR family transcriptional regulator [Flavonifractor sp.]